MSKYEILTIKIIKERFWDPVTKKGKPITFFYAQDFNEEEDDYLDTETMTPNGNLIESGNIIEDWLSKPEDGPYNNTNPNRDIYYYLQFNEKFNASGDNVLQIGCFGAAMNVNNYLSADVLDGVDCWIKKEASTQEKFMYCVSSFVLDSNGRSHVKLTVYENYEAALNAYEKYKKTLNYKYIYEPDEPNSKDYQKIIEVHGLNGQKSISEEGSWKRPYGYELLCIPITKTEYSFDIKSWPDIRTYE